MQKDNTNRHEAQATYPAELRRSASVSGANTLNQKDEDFSLMESSDLVIKPQGGDSSVNLSAASPEKSKKTLGEPLVEEVPLKHKRKKQKKNIFALRLKQLQDKKHLFNFAKKEKPVIKDETKTAKVFKFIKSRHHSVFTMILKNVFFAIVGLGIFVATLSVDNVLFASQKEEEVKEYTYLHLSVDESVNVSLDGKTEIAKNGYQIQEGLEISTNSSDNVEIALLGQGVLRLASNTSLTFDKVDEKAKRYLVTLKEGSIWGNIQFDDYDLDIKTETVLVTPGASSFSINYDGNLTRIYADNHDIFVGIRDKGKTINSFWLAEGNQARISDSKVKNKADTIQKLLYSKLIKEFGYGRLSVKKIQDDPWLSVQKEEDVNYSNSVQASRLADIRKKGLRTLRAGSISSQTKALFTDLRTALTFSEKKKTDNLMDSIFANLQDAKYQYLQGDDTDAAIRLSLFKEDISDPAYISNTGFKQSLFNKLHEEFFSLQFAIPGDPIYPVKEQLYRELLSVNMRPYLNANFEFDLLTSKLNDVYDSIDDNPVDGISAFSDYTNTYKTVVAKYRNDIDKVGDQIVRQNVLVDNILFIYPELYSLSNFEAKQLIEEDYLLVVNKKADKKELKQTFISSKIDLLNRIRYFLFNDRLEADNARQIVFFLVRNIEDLQGDTLQLAAINELFEKRMQDIGVFWEYLKSPEYYDTNLHGSSHEERFEAFKSIQEKEITYQDIRKEILGKKEMEDLTVEKVLVQAEKDMESAGFSNIEFGFYEDVNQPRIPVLKAKAGGIEFRATYDWDRKLLSSIIVDEDLISADGVKLEKAKQFIYQAVSAKTKVIKRPVPKPVEPEEEDPQADVKNVAEVFMAQKFKQFGMIVTKDEVVVVDLKNGIYQIDNVYFENNRSAKFSFTYDSVEDMVIKLVVHTKKGDEEFDNAFEASLLEKIVKKVYEDSL